MSSYRSRLPNALQWAASWNPITVMVAALRELFGNPVAPVTQHTWPLEDPTLAAVLYWLVVLAVGVVGALRRYRTRTTD